MNCEPAPIMRCARHELRARVVGGACAGGSVCALPGLALCEAFCRDGPVRAFRSDLRGVLPRSFFLLGFATVDFLRRLIYNYGCYGDRNAEAKNAVRRHRSEMIRWTSRNCARF